MLVSALHDGPHLGAADPLLAAVAVDQFAVLDDFVETRAAPDRLESCRIGPIDRDLYLVDASIHQFPVIVLHVPERGVGGGADTDLSRAGVFDHLEEDISLHVGFADAL